MNQKAINILKNEKISDEMKIIKLQKIGLDLEDIFDLALKLGHESDKLSVKHKEC